jgi:uncharacterized protein YjbI with pentapeptide repeats
MTMTGGDIGSQSVGASFRGRSLDGADFVILVVLVGRWGTQFIDADLTGADFTGTDAGRCGAKGATLDGVISSAEAGG